MVVRETVEALPHQIRRDWPTLAGAWRWTYRRPETPLVDDRAESLFIHLRGEARPRARHDRVALPTRAARIRLESPRSALRGCRSAAARHQGTFPLGGGAGRKPVELLLIDIGIGREAEAKSLRRIFHRARRSSSGQRGEWRGVRVEVPATRIRSCYSEPQSRNLLTIKIDTTVQTDLTGMHKPVKMLLAKCKFDCTIV